MEPEKIISQVLIAIGLFVGVVGKPIRKNVAYYFFNKKETKPKAELKRVLSFLKNLDDLDDDLEIISDNHIKKELNKNKND